MNTLRANHRCSHHPQVTLVFSGYNRQLNATRFLCPLCTIAREFSSGVVKHVNHDRGFLFIDNGSGQNFHAHTEDLAVLFFPRLGQPVQFEVGRSEKGFKALTVRPLDGINHS